MYDVLILSVHNKTVQHSLCAEEALKYDGALEVAKKHQASYQNSPMKLGADSDKSQKRVSNLFPFSLEKSFR